MRPAGMPIQIAPMKLLDAEIDFRPVAIAAYFVYGHERVMEIERRVLEAFGHDRSCELLPLQHELQIVRLSLSDVPRRLDQQNASQKIEGGAFSRNGDCIGYVCEIGFGD